MSISALLIQGLQLMLMGMGFVFVFLGLLVIAVSSISRLLSAHAPSATAIESTVPNAPADRLSDPELVSVITAAVHKFREQAKDSSKE